MKKMDALRVVCTALAATALAVVAGCGGSSSSPAEQHWSVTPSSTAATDQVVLTGAETATDQVTLKVQVGASTSAHVYSFAFDILVSDPSAVQVASITAGNALTGAPSAQAILSGSRIVVGVTSTSGTGNTLTAGSTVATIVLRMLKSSTTTLRFTGAAPSTSATDALVLDNTLPAGAPAGVTYSNVTWSLIKS